MTSKLKDNKIVITIKDGKTAVNTAAPLAFDDLCTVLLNLILMQMRKIVSSCPKENQKDAKGSLYDIFNVMASSVLKHFAPEFELRPNLTTLAIKEAEDKIIMAGRFDEFERYT